MSWSLQLRNGDLALNGASFGQVSGPLKSVQDLRCAILERRGSDDHHPSFGSLIDGGIDTDGTEVTSVIANSDPRYVTSRVETEIRRLVAEQQRRQLARAQADRYAYGQSTLDNAELIVSVGSIGFTQVQDTLYVSVTLVMGNGANVSIQVPVNDVPIS